MKLAIAVPSGGVIAVDDLDRWRVNLSTGQIDKAPAIERVILNGATGAVEIIVFASAPT